MRSRAPLLPILALLLLAGCGPTASASRTSDNNAATGTSAAAGTAMASNAGTPGCGTPSGRFTHGGGSLTEQSGVSGSFACDGGVHGEFSADE